MFFIQCLVESSKDFFKLLIYMNKHKGKVLNCELIYQSFKLFTSFISKLYFMSQYISGGIYFL